MFNCFYCFPVARNMIPMDPLVIVSVLAGFLVIFRLIMPVTALFSMVLKQFRSLEDRCYLYQFYRVPEYNGFQENALYRRVSTYLSSLSSIEDTDFANLIAGKKQNEIVLQLDPSQTVQDSFLGAKMWWRNEISHLVLKIRKKDKSRILKPYLQHVQAVVDEIETRKREIKLFTNAGDGNQRWRSVPFKHPATFETVAMDLDLKTKVKSDLEAFVKAKQYYHRLGRSWKRGYLFYGPAGTGKSSMIAAMANFLNYNIYDLELGKVSGDSDLKLLLTQTSQRSILAIEDIDRYLEFKGEKTVSLSGILNFMDGLWSCSGDERIMVITMNSKDEIDPAILRPGRLDLHVYFPHCTFPAFKTLANNYLGVKDHKLFPHVEEVFLAGGTCLTPAEIGEILIVNRNSPSRALKSVINALQLSIGKSGKVVGPYGNGAAGNGRRLSERLTESGSQNGRSEGSPEHGGMVCQEQFSSVLEFKKLYGLLRLKSNRKPPFEFGRVGKES